MDGKIEGENVFISRCPHGGGGYRHSGVTRQGRAIVGWGGGRGRLARRNEIGGKVKGDRAEDLFPDTVHNDFLDKGMQELALDLRRAFAEALTEL